MENKAAKREYMNCKTSVWWNMDSCPVPAGYDHSLVAPSIHMALEKLGYRGPITITATGALKRTSQDDLRTLSSTGITVKYESCCVILGSYNTLHDLVYWQQSNPAPATIMLTSGRLLLDLASYDLRSLQKKGYNILLAYRSPQPQKVCSKLVASAEWRWKTLLEDAMFSVNQREARRRILQEECSKTCECYSFACRICKSAWQSLEEFTTHLDGLDHQVKKFECVADPSDLDTVSQDILEKRLEKTKLYYSSGGVEDEAEVKLATTILKRKIQWETLKKKLKERNQLSSQRSERLMKRKLVNEGAESSRRKNTDEVASQRQD